MPDLAILELDTRGLDTRDAALAHALYDAVVTRWMTLSYIVGKLGRVTMSELEPRMQAALLGGAAQLLLMDRIPVHAALDETVQWAKDTIRPGAGGMANAILRKVARAKGEKAESWNNEPDRIPLSEGGALVLRGVDLPADSKRRLSIACSLPLDLLRGWFAAFGPPRAMAQHTLARAPVTLYTGAARAALPEDLLGPHDSGSHRVFTGTRGELVELLGSRDDLWVQDAASSSVVDSLEPSDAEVVVDLCAGQGTKTRQLLERFGRAQVWACEVDEARLEALDRVFGENERVRVLHVDDLEGASACADVVLTDVPCSNTGVLARRGEARYRPMDARLARLLPIQRTIAGNAVRLLRAGGTLVYSTCSLERAENEEQAAWIAGNLGCTLVDEERVNPSGLPGEASAGYRDGSYRAVLRAGDLGSV